MKNITLCFVVAILISGCTTISTKKADYTKDPQGFRITPSKQILVVNTDLKKSYLVLIQDKEAAYDVKPIAVFSKHEFEFEVNDIGALTKVKSSQDATSIISLFQRAAELSQGETGGGNFEAVREINSTFGLDSGYYEWKNNKFVKVK